jgi:hypothetical protein
MIVLFDGMEHLYKADATRRFTVRKVVYGGHFGFCLAWHEAWRRNDWDDNDGLFLSRAMARQTCGGSQGSKATLRSPWRCH